MTQTKIRANAFHITLEKLENGNEIVIEQRGIPADAIISVPIEQIDWFCEQLQIVKRIAEDDVKALEQFEL